MKITPWVSRMTLWDPLAIFLWTGPKKIKTFFQIAVSDPDQVPKYDVQEMNDDLSIFQGL